MSTALTINWEQLELVIGEDGEPCDPEMKELFRLFVEDAGGRLRTLNGPERDPEPAAIAREAHKIRGAASSFGFDQVAGLLTTVELQIADLAPARIDALLQEALHAFDLSVQEVGAKHPDLVS